MASVAQVASWLRAKYDGLSPSARRLLWRAVGAGATVVVLRFLALDSTNPVVNTAQDVAAAVWPIVQPLIASAGG